MFETAINLIEKSAKTKSATFNVRVETEDQAISLINDIRTESVSEVYEVDSATYKKRVKKSKGEIIDEWVNVSVTLKMIYADEEE